MAESIHTAAEFAKVFGISPRDMRRKLRGVPHAGMVDVKGQITKAWTVTELPPALRTRLAELARVHGHRSVEDLFHDAPQPWRPPLAWSEVPDAYKKDAERLRDVLWELLPLQGEIEAKELIQRACARYRAVFGHPVKPARLWYIIDRAARRDNKFLNWGRPDIYLDEAAFQKHRPDVSSLKRQAMHRQLDEIIAALDNRSKPTADDREWLFNEAFHHLEELMGLEVDPSGHKALKTSLIDYLYAALPGLTKGGVKSLRRVFNALFYRWSMNGKTRDAIRDPRNTRSGNFRRPEFAEDVEAIRQQAVNFDGNESLAHRYLREHGQLTGGYEDYYPFNPRKNKSYLPHSIRQEITPGVEAGKKYRRGPRHARLAGPHTPRDWSNVAPGDYFSGDDVTWNLYFKFDDDEGITQVTRGECLVGSDFKTGYPLAFCLIPGHYNSEHIRHLCLKMHDAVGLPRVGFYFEQSTWKARMVPGERRRGAQHVHWRETEYGLQKEGIQVELANATTPRAKTIEGHFRIIQERMRRLPGFIGFNERLDKRERESDLVIRARKGDASALSRIPTMEQWIEVIAEEIEHFANDPQNGKILDGQSPREAWEGSIINRPLRKLPDFARHILSTHKQRVRVTDKGVRIQIRGKQYLYANDATGELQFNGGEAWAYYNVETPELLTLSDINRKKFWAAKRIELPARGATDIQLRDVNDQKKAHAAPAKALWGRIKHNLVSTISRDSEHDTQTKELGEFHNAAVDTHKAAEAERGIKLRRIQRKGNAHGLPVPERPKNPDRVLVGFEKERAIREKLARKAEGGSAVKII